MGVFFLKKLAGCTVLEFVSSSEQLVQKQVDFFLEAVRLEKPTERLEYHFQQAFELSENSDYVHKYPLALILLKRYLAENNEQKIELFKSRLNIPDVPNNILQAMVYAPENRSDLYISLEKYIIDIYCAMNLSLDQGFAQEKLVAARQGDSAAQQLFIRHVYDAMDVPTRSTSEDFIFLAQLLLVHQFAQTATSAFFVARYIPLVLSQEFSFGLESQYLRQGIELAQDAPVVGYVKAVARYAFVQKQLQPLQTEDVG